MGKQENRRPEITGEGVAVAVASPAVETPAKTVAPAADLGFISPVVARLALAHDVDLKQVVGTGLKGRIRKKDVLAYIERSDAETASLRDDIQTAAEEGRPASGDQIIPLSRMRRLIAEHMVQSKRTSPHVTTVFVCDLTAVVRHRDAQKDAFAQNGANLTFTPYFVAAIVSALK